MTVSIAIAIRVSGRWFKAICAWRRAIVDNPILKVYEGCFMA